MSTPPRAVAGLTLAVLTASVGTSAANVALPALVRAFAQTPGQVQWVVLAYLLGMTSVSVAAGAAGDRWGRRRVLVSGIVLFTVGAAAGALAPSLTTLVIARAAQGIGAAVMTALPLALAKDVAAEGRIGRTMGLLGTASALGTALGPALGGVLIGWGGWAAPLWMMVVLGAMTLPLALTLPSTGTAPPPIRRFDVGGNVLLAAGVVTYALALASPTPNGPTGPLLIAAVALLVGFFCVERRADAPVLPPAMMRRRILATGMITNVLVATVMMTTLVVGPYALHDGLQLPLPLVGLVLAVSPAISAISGVLAGRLVDRRSPPVMITLSLAILTIGAVSLAALPSWWGVAGYVSALFILTPGYQLFLAANNTHTLGAVDAAQRGTVAGALGLSRNLGLVTGASAMAAIYATLDTGADTAAEGSLDAARTTLLIAALLAALAAAISSIPARALRPRMPRTPRRERP